MTGDSEQVPQEFIDGLNADVVIPVGPKGRALSIGEALSLRSWFDRRRRAETARDVRSEPGESNRTAGASDG